MVAAHPQHHIGILQMANSGARTHDFHRGKPHHQTLVKAARAAKQRGRLGGLVVMLGVMESGSKQAAEQMFENGQLLIETLRQDIGDPGLPVFWSLPERNGEYKLTRAAARRLARDVPNVEIIEYDGVSHFELEQYLEWADEAVATVDKHDLFPKTSVLRVEWADEATRRVAAGKPLTLAVDIPMNVSSTRSMADRCSPCLVNDLSAAGKATGRFFGTRLTSRNPFKRRRPSSM